MIRLSIISYIAFLFLLLPSFTINTSANAFSFWFTSTPAQCQTMTVQWNGGQAPYTLLLVPTGHLNPETRVIIQENIVSGNSVSFVLNFPADSKFVAMLNDATGVGAGGTSIITTVAQSSNSSCLSTTPSQTEFYFYIPDSIEQCDSIDISWDATAQDPVDVLALIPGGKSFEIANVTDAGTNTSWTADVRSGTDIMFVVGDKDGLGKGGSSDVLQVGNGDDSCINDDSPSSTSSPFAGGVFSTQGSGGAATSLSSESAMTKTSSSGFVPTDTSSTGPGSTTGFGETTSTTANAGNGNKPSSGASIPQDSNGGNSGTASATALNPSGSDGGGQSGGNSNQSPSGFPGSGGGTVTGSPDGLPNTETHHGNTSLILALILGLLALLGIVSGAYFLYRRKQRPEAYRNIETGGYNGRSHTPWIAALTRGAHLRGGAGSSIDTLPSMYQTEPFIYPNGSHSSYSGNGGSAIAQRPPLAARVSSSRSISAFISGAPYARDAFGTNLTGVHGPPAAKNARSSIRERKGSIGSYRTSLNRSPSERALESRPAGRMPPPLIVHAPVRVSRDSEDFSPDPDEVSPNPLGEDFFEIPPTYQSVRRASASSRNINVGNRSTDDWTPPVLESGVRLERSNASRYSYRSSKSSI